MITDNFTFRNILPEEMEQAIKIEQICFPPHEACTPKQMKERIKTAPEMFLVAVDNRTGKIAGFLCGLSTNERVFRDEFFMDASLYETDGENVMLLGLDVLPEYRNRGLAREIMSCYICREKDRGRKRLFLTCLEEKIEMYEKMGYTNMGISRSVWGNEIWYDMQYLLY